VGRTVLLSSAGVLFLALSTGWAERTTIAQAAARSKARTGPAVDSRWAGSTTAAMAEVLGFERELEAAAVRGDVALLDKRLSADFSFTHGDGWTTGGEPLKVDDKKAWLDSVAKRPYLARDLDSVKVELHGDVAITYGRYVATNRNGVPGRSRFTVWFERVYARRDGQWQFLSHRTVRGPSYDR
jgi:hypothetical protein